MEIKINLNEQVKFKLTDFGKDIYYHRFDDVNRLIISNGGEPLASRMPETDKDGYTKMQLWDFMSVFGKHMGIAKPEVLYPLEIIYDTK